MSDLQLLVGRRKVIRKKVTDFHKVSHTYLSLDGASKLSKRNMLLSYKSNLLDLDSKIQDLKLGSEDFSEADLNAELETCQDYLDKIEFCLPLLESNAGSSSSGSSDVARSLLKQPIAPLPKFTSSENEDLLMFFKDFECTTSAYQYPDRDLLLLLRQQVEGRARVLLSSLETDKQTYSDAKDLLVLAFASEESRKVSVIKQLTELRLNKGDDPFSFISKLRTINESVKTLKITSQDFLQYFTWLGLGEDFQKELIQITNKTRPSFDEIITNFFTACERYENNIKLRQKSSSSVGSKKSQADTTSLAVKVNSNSSKKLINCTLCSKINVKDSDHAIFKCTKFPTPQSKCDKLKELDGCIKCGSLNHLSDKCRFRFKKRCFSCSGWHFSFLCNKASTQNKNENSKCDVAKAETNSGVAVLPSISSNSVLATFTFHIPGNTDLIRALKDGGSQNSFVSEKVANMNNFKIIKDNISLTVNGFNGTKKYHTKVVEIPMNLGKNLVKVYAMIVPEINVKLKLPKLGSVVEGFKSRGYSFADKLLDKHTNEIGNIDLLLGSDAAHCLLGQDVSFGEDCPSVYISSSYGIMLVGDINKLLSNLKNLPLCESYVSQGLQCPSCNKTPSHSESSADSSSLVSTHSFLVSSDYITPLVDDEIHDLSLQMLETNCSFSVLNDKGKIVETKLQEATNQILESECYKYINYDQTLYDDESVELNNQLINFSLNNIVRENDGRLRVPLLWNGKVSHLLSKNENIAHLILKSNFKKLQKNKEHLLLMDQVIKDQLDAGIIEPVENLEFFKQAHPDYSFLPHMAIFKPDRITTKCRIVFLSNLKETENDKKMSLSHNQCMYPGPPLNQKLSSALLHLRFDRILLTYDLKKAFNMLSLGDSDQAKLLFLWFRNVKQGDFTVVTYRNVRLSFGLRPSPFLLMIALYYILVLDTNNDESHLIELKKLMYALLYMDNGAISCNDVEYIQWAYSKLPDIFAPYKFGIQQLITNDISLQRKIDDQINVETPVTNKLFGLSWDRIQDELFTRPINLNVDANTKRTILKTIAAQFDIYGFNMPLLNRSRLFMHRLQCQKNLGWDKPLSQEYIREWKNIAKQANAAPPIKLERYVGPRNGSYKLIAYTDASHALYGVVVFLLHIESGRLSFVQAKNRMVNTQLNRKSIPSLELNAIALGVETLMELQRDLAGSACIKPINITELLVYTDSLCALHWLNASSYKLEKMQRHTVFVRNRIGNIHRLCERLPVKFCFIAGKANPADNVTRCISYKCLLKSNFFGSSDLDVLKTEENFSNSDNISVIIPNPLTLCDDQDNSQQFPVTAMSSSTEIRDQVVDPNMCSSFRKLILIHRRVLACIQKWKKKAHIVSGYDTTGMNLFSEAIRNVILTEQRKWYPNVFSYFDNCKCNLKDIPNLITQLNIYLDSNGILRVRSKFKKWFGKEDDFPILLPRESSLVKMIVLDTHSRLAHSGCYSVLAEIRRYFYIPRHFSTIKKILKQCTHCRRFNGRTFRLNQNSYRDFRSDPPSTPFSNIFVDYLGPFVVKKENVSHKVWLLCIACTWTRAINLKICNDLSVKEFLRAFQLHCFEFGIPQLCISDLGTQLTAGANTIQNFLSDHEAQLYFEENNVRPLTFQQYFKGCSKLGSLVEVCVKMVKRLLFGSIKNNVLSYSDFEYLVCHTVHLANRRPIAFKEALREGDAEGVPEPITPEQIIKGYELTSLNLIPELQQVPDDPEWQSDLNPSQHIKDEYMKLRKVRATLIEKYHSEFLGTLVAQAVDKKDRYSPVIQQNIKAGDLVLLKEVHTKPNNYPMGMVKKIEVNSNNEVTGAVVLKGKTRELVQRHISTLIPLLQVESVPQSFPDCSKVDDSSFTDPNRVRRKAAVVSEERTRQMLD